MPERVIFVALLIILGGCSSVRQEATLVESNRVRPRLLGGWKPALIEFFTDPGGYWSQVRDPKDEPLYIEMVQIENPYIETDDADALCVREFTGKFQPVAARDYLLFPLDSSALLYDVIVRDPSLSLSFVDSFVSRRRLLLIEGDQASSDHLQVYSTRGDDLSIKLMRRSFDRKITWKIDNKTSTILRIREGKPID